MRVLSTVRFTALRMARNYLVLLLLLVVPILLLTLFSFILSGAVTESGTPYLNETALTMVLCFQLFGGSVVMSYIQVDFFSDNKMRIHVLPFNRTMYAFSIATCGTVFSIVLGVILMTFTQLVLGVVWDNWLWSIYIVMLMATLSSIVCLIFTFSVKDFKLAERLSEVYGVGFIVLAGLFFPMPQSAFFDFMGSYGNPLALSVGAVKARAVSDSSEAWLQANILLAAIILLFGLMLVVGRRKLS